jgi:hypothetical protein
MGRVEQTYYLVRLAEERQGPVVAVGDRLILARTLLYGMD